MFYVRDARSRRSIGLILLLTTAPICILLVALLIVVFVARVLPRSGGWPLLRNVEQSFTGISAVLSALALCAVAYTCGLQYRQIRNSGIQTQRSAQLDLIQMAFKNEDFARTLGYTGSTESDFTSWKTTVYRNLFSCTSKWHSEPENCLHWNCAEPSH
jgi:uncharacterized protein DUF6082